MGGDGPQHTLDFGFGAFHDRAFTKRDTVHTMAAADAPDGAVFSSAAPSGAVSFRLALCPLGTVILSYASSD